MDCWSVNFYKANCKRAADILEQLRGCCENS